MKHIIVWFILCRNQWNKTFQQHYLISKSATWFYFLNPLQSEQSAYSTFKISNLTLNIQSVVLEWYYLEFQESCIKNRAENIERPDVFSWTSYGRVREFQEYDIMNWK